MRLAIRRDVCRDGYSVWIIREYPSDGQMVREVAKPFQIEFENFTPTHKLPEPSFFLPTEDFHSLLNSGSQALAELGILASVEALKAELEAVKKHRDNLIEMMKRTLEYPFIGETHQYRVTV